MASPSFILRSPPGPNPKDSVEDICKHATTMHGSHSKPADAAALQGKFEIVSTFAYSHGLSCNPVLPDIVKQCYLFEYAVDRLVNAAREFSWANVVDYLTHKDSQAVLAEAIESHMQSEHAEYDAPDRFFIVRVAFRRDGRFTLMSGERPYVSDIQMYPTALAKPSRKRVAKSVPIVPVHVDVQGAMVPSAFTRHKTTFRDPYTEARSRVGLKPTTPFINGEVLLSNTAGEVMDGGFTTLYFWREDESGEPGWRTPRRESGAKLGVSRRWALENAGVTEAPVMLKDVVDGEIIWMSSAVTGFVKGKVTFTSAVPGQMD